MNKLWYVIEFKELNDGNKYRGLNKFIIAYLIPNIIAIILGYYNLNKSNLLKQWETNLLLIIFLNLAIALITQFVINNSILSNIEEDVILKFIPDKAFSYISFRILINLIKWNLPFLLYSGIYFRKYVENNNFQYVFICALLTITWIVLNYLIALRIKYINNNFTIRKKKLIKIFLFLVYILVLLIVPQIIVIKILDEIALNEIANISDIFYLDQFSFNIIVAIFIISSLWLKIKVRYYKLNSVKLISIIIF